MRVSVCFLGGEDLESEAVNNKRGELGFLMKERGRIHANW